MILESTLVYEIKGITKTHLLKNEKGDKTEYLIQTEGLLFLIKTYYFEKIILNKQKYRCKL